MKQGRKFKLNKENSNNAKFLLRVILVWLVIIIIGLTVLELYTRKLQNYKVFYPRLEKKNIFLPGDIRRVWNKLYVGAFPENFRNWPVHLETFDPEEKFGERVMIPDFLFTPNGKYKLKKNEINPFAIRSYLKTFEQAKNGEEFFWFTNSLGFRGEEISEKKEPGVIRIICLGGSVTEGVNANNQTYPYYLEQELVRRFPGKKFEVLNAGIGGQGASGLLTVLKTQIFKLDPDVLIYYELGNNINEFEQIKKSEIHGSNLIYQKIKSTSVIFNLFSQMLKLTPPQQTYIYDENLPDYTRQKYMKSLREIVGESRKRGIKFAIVTPVHGYYEGIWSRGDVPSNLYWQYSRWYPVEPPDIVRWYQITSVRFSEIAKEFNVPYIDVASGFPKDSVYFASFRGLLDPSHLSPVGEKLFATYVAQGLIDKVLPKVLN